MFRGRFACVRQTDQSDCGAAALATVALHYRRPLGVPRLRDHAGTDRVGTNLLGLVQAAERLGFSAKGVRGRTTRWPGCPCLPSPTCGPGRPSWGEAGTAGTNGPGLEG